MADVTTETTTDTAPTVTPAEQSGVLDLRPPKESVRGIVPIGVGVFQR